MADADNDNYVEELKQLRNRQAKVVEEIDRMKGDLTGEALGEIERIQGEAVKIVVEIDQIKRREEKKLEALIDWNTFLYRTRPAGRPRHKIGGVWV